MSEHAFQVEHNPAAGRFEAAVDGQLAQAQYRRVGERILFTHTEVPEQLEGRGIASKLAKTALDYSRAEGLTVVPLCPFIASYIERHPEYADLVGK